MAIHVCSLARLPSIVADSGARHLITVMGNVDKVQRPPSIAPDNHLVISMDDIAFPVDGFVAPNDDHIARMIAFGRDWDRARPLVVHCWAGISRSTASAFALACALNPSREEIDIAARMRARSASACPNRLIVAIADRLLARQGRMIAAIDAMGPGNDATEGQPFVVGLD